MTDLRDPLEMALSCFRLRGGERDMRAVLDLFSAAAVAGGPLAEKRLDRGLSSSSSAASRRGVVPPLSLKSLLSISVGVMTANTSALPD
jgi:hypothetical protein